MKEFGHFNLPAPIIKDPHGAIEDERGRLWITQKLVGELQGGIERLDEIARKHKHNPQSLSDDVFVVRAEALSALAEAIDERLDHALQMHDAIVDHLNREAHAKAE
ncbi:hypothetical protein [Pelagerythrobacter sp.]|uniref:hypothetical protein n=1 Tax=Pelagerythrobacter sp. TaxID=2800702 RepID=UPI0035B1CA8E